jgi:hypothetical protein
MAKKIKKDEIEETQETPIVERREETTEEKNDRLGG